MNTELQQTLYNDIKIEGEKLRALSYYLENDFDRLSKPLAIIRYDLDALINGMNSSIFRIKTLQSRVRKFKENFN